MAFAFIRQVGMMECGPTCLAMILKHYGYYNVTRSIVKLCDTNVDGVSFYELSKVSELLGFNADAYELDDEKYLHEITLPCIAHYEGNHFVVIYKVKGTEVWVADPAIGKVRYFIEDFKKKWNGVVLVLSPPGNIKKLEKDLELLFEEQHRGKKSIFQKFYAPIFQNNRKYIIQIILISIMLQFLMLGVPFLTQVIFDHILPTQNHKLLIGILLTLILIFTAQVGISYIRNILILKIRVRFEYDFFSTFFKHFIYLNQQYFDRIKKEDFMHRFGQNIQIRELTNPILMQGVIDFAISIVYIPLFFFYNVNLAWLASGIILLYVIVIGWFTPRIFTLMNHASNKNTVSLGKFLDTLLGIQTVKLLALEQIKFEEWRRGYRNALNSAIVAEQESMNLFAFQKFVFLFGQTSVFGYGAYMIFNNGISVGQYISFTAIFMIMIGNMNNLGLVWIMLTHLSLSLTKVNDVLQYENEEPEPFKKISHFNPNNIVFKDVRFKYHPSHEDPALDLFNLEIHAGENIGVIGRNGSGKTTFAKLMLGFYSTYEGKILIGDIDVRKLSSSALRRKIFLFPQNVYIFQGTIKENIGYGNLNASMEQIVEAAKSADLHDFIKSQHLGYNQIIGEFGSGLSGGQILKLGFCRLFLSAPEVIILDEASSMLDLETEKKILENVKKRFRDKIIISIAHRLHTLKGCDQIFVIDKGRVAEKGSHDSLSKKGGIYHNLMSQYVNY